MKYRFKPNHAQKNAYIEALSELEDWIAGDGKALRAERASTGSVYFTIKGTHYRVASHKPGVNYSGEVMFHAAPTRAPEIADALLAGKKLNGRGFIK